MNEIPNVRIEEPKGNPWYQARLLWAMEFQPSLIKELWKEGPEALHNYLLEHAKIGVLAAHNLRKAGRLSEDQIQEVVQDLIAPLNLDPEPEPMPEDLEEEIMTWAETY